MWSFLKQANAGAKPGKKRSIPKESETDKKKTKLQYEANRKPITDPGDLIEKWKKDGKAEGKSRDWLMKDPETLKMKCTICIEIYGVPQLVEDQVPEKKHAFLHGSGNFRKSAIIDHEESLLHVEAQQKINIKKSGVTGIQMSKAGEALKKIKSANRQKVSHLFRNAHAVAVHNRPLTDFTWLGQLDNLKETITGQTYINNKACLDFIATIAANVREDILHKLANANFISFLMDGSTDISGDEQESVFVHSSRKGVVSTNFLCISSPKSTTAEHLFEHVLKIFHETGLQTEVDKGKY